MVDADNDNTNGNKDNKTLLENLLKYNNVSRAENIEYVDDFDFNEDLAKEFCVIDTDKCARSTKLDFALNQFVNAFYEYERLQKKYPELMKVM